MGMAATQARFLSLTARRSNIEFQGQQINQQRTTLSNQSASYYSQLCNMVVPTPPSVDDYTKVTYTFNDGAMTNAITTMLTNPNKATDGAPYLISYIQQWQDDYTPVEAATSFVSRIQESSGEYGYYIGSNKLVKLAEINPGDDEDLQALLKQEEAYKYLLNEKYNNGENKDWYVRYIEDQTSGVKVPYFYQESDLDSDNKFTDEGYASIRCYTIGSATKTKEVLNQPGTVERDSSGRYIAVTLYETDEEGKVDTTKATTYSLTTNTTTDEAAYNDALNEYKYQQAQYDQKIQDINSKLEIVQQQDKSLELNLKQLDTEEQAINTEIDAVQKIISKNVNESFGTFSKNG